MLTKEEKAKRFDSLQFAFEIAKDTYKRRSLEASAKYKTADIIGAYNKGLADAYAQMLEDIERWIV